MLLIISCSQKCIFGKFFPNLINLNALSNLFCFSNLFFRTAYLLLMDIQPVFILDGEAPQLKHQTIQKRNEIQFIGARPRTQPKDSESVKTKKKELKGRTRFKYVLKQCSDLLATMGVRLNNFESKIFIEIFLIRYHAFKRLERLRRYARG